MHALDDATPASGSSAQADVLQRREDATDEIRFSQKTSDGFDPLMRYSVCVSKAPGCFTCIYLLLFTTVIVAMWKDIDIETDFGVFIRADGEAVRHQDALTLAVKKQKGVSGRRLAKEASPGTRRLQNQAFSHWRKRSVEFVYHAKSGNALDEQVLKEMRDFELSLRRIPKWQVMCIDRIFNKHWTWGCEPGESLSPFAWPRLTQPNRTGNGNDPVFDINFDANGKNLMPFTVMFALMQDEMLAGSESRDLKRYFPTGWDVNAFLSGTGPPPSSIRSRFTFYIGYAHYGWTRTQVRNELRKVDKEIEEFMTTEVYDKIEEWIDADPDEVGERHMNLYYTSNYIDEHEMMLTLNRDLLFSAGSVAFVSFWMWFQMRSVFLSVACFFVVFGSVPLAFVLSPAERTTLASLAPIFLITIIDIDVIFVFVNFWIQGKGAMCSLHERIAWTISNAGKSCMATSLTTSVSFFANLVSAVQPLREFGLLMGVCVMAVYVLALLVLPPLMMLEHRFSQWREDRESARLYSQSGACTKTEEPGFSIVPVATVIDVSGGRECEACSPLKLTNGHDLSDIRDESPETGYREEARSPSPSPSIGSHTDPTRSQQTIIKKRTTRFFINPRHARSCSHKCLFALVEFISSCAWTVIFCTALTVPIFIWGIAANIELDLDEPKLFPEEHNQNRVFQLLDDFDDSEELKSLIPPSAGGAACNATHVNGMDGASQCLIHWCDSASDSTVWNTSTVTCHRSATVVQDSGILTSVGFGLESCSTIKMYNRFASNGPQLEESDFNKAWSRILDEAAGYTIAASSKQRHPGQRIGRLAIESWEEGSVQTHNLYRSSIDVVLETTSTADKFCLIDTFCFSNMPGCSLKAPDWTSHGLFNIDSLNRRLSVNRDVEMRLSKGGGVPERHLSSSSTEVSIVWGITAPLSSPIVGAPDWKWRFDPTFELFNPWAQRAISNVCQRAVAERELYVRKIKCWMLNFKNWLRDIRGERFPSRQFDEEVIMWFNTAASWEDKAQLWFVDRKVVACQIQLYPSIPAGMSTEGVLQNKAKWDRWLASMNLEASLTANNAWHSSQRWVTAEANDVIINSTVLTIVLELGIGGLCILIFTGDPILALIVLGLVIINIGGLAFMMVAVFKWLIGPIEVICLVVFVGYSVTFGLHISGDYARVQEDDADLVVNNRIAKEMQRIGLRRFWKAFNATIRVKEEESAGPCSSKLSLRDQRLERTRMAMLHVGGAIMSAAFSSAGTSIFLMMCTLTIFNKIGAVVMTITILSVVVTLISLPAALIVVGPNFHPCYKRCFRGSSKFLKKREEPLLHDSQEAT